MRQNCLTVRGFYARCADAQHPCGVRDVLAAGVLASDHSYEVTIDIELPLGAHRALVFHDRKLFAGLGADDAKLHACNVSRDQICPLPGRAEGRRMSVPSVNNDNVASSYIHSASKPYDHDSARGFIRVRRALLASGFGNVTFPDEPIAREIIRQPLLEFVGISPAGLANS